MTAIADLPDLRPSLLLDFANSGRVDPRIQCTRASSATCFGPDGKLRTVAANVPRIDYDPATGKCLGLLVEEQRTNLVKRSNELSHADWVKTGLVGIGAPDTNLMTKLVATTENRTHELYSTTPPIGFADDTLLTISVEAKAGGSNFFWLRCVNKAGSFPSATFNLLTGAASLRGATSANMKSLGGGVYRCSATFNLGAGASVSAGRTVLALAAGEGANAEVFAGDGVAGVWFRNVQTEVGAFPTSYIPTEASAVTRAADTAQLHGAQAVGQWLNASQGTLLARSRAFQSTRKQTTIAALTDGSAANRAMLRGDTSASQGVGGFVVANAADSLQGTYTPLRPTTGVSVAISYATNSAAISAYGDILRTSFSGQPPQGIDRLVLGNAPHTGSAEHFNGHISLVAYYPVRITNEQLQRLTA